ncbi:hypothetical protein BDQ17DRAFT_10241 [Cyathus striatus]|nr:hypothetical protein BDQ17DRAFT_10241 [Cyathus striatus]
MRLRSRVRRSANRRTQFPRHMIGVPAKVFPPSISSYLHTPLSDLAKLHIVQFPP